MSNIGIEKTPAQPTTEAPPMSPVEFVAARDRFRVVPLAWPVTYQGQLIESVTVRRLTVAEVRDFVNQAAAGAGVRFPGLNVPPEVMDGLDDDDAAQVEKAVSDFLPRRLAQVFASARATGEPQPA